MWQQLKWLKTGFVSLIPITISPLVIASCAQNVATNPNHHQINTINDYKVVNEQIINQLIVANIKTVQDLLQLGISLDLINAKDQALTMIKQKWINLTNQNQTDFDPNLALNWNVNTTSQWTIKVLATQAYDLNRLANNDQRIFLSLKIAFYYQNQFISTKMIQSDDFQTSNYPIKYQFNSNYDQFLNQIPLTNDDLIYHRLVSASHQANVQSGFNFNQVQLLIDEQQRLTIVKSIINEDQLGINLKAYDQALQQWLIAKLNAQASDQNPNLIPALQKVLIAKLKLLQTSQLKHQWNAIEIDNQISKIDLKQLNLKWTQQDQINFNQADWATKMHILALDQSPLNANQLAAKIALLINANYFTFDQLTNHLVFTYHDQDLQLWTNDDAILANLISYVQNWSGQVEQINQLVNHIEMHQKSLVASGKQLSLSAPIIIRGHQND